MKDDHGIKVDDGQPLTLLQRLGGYLLLAVGWFCVVALLLGIPLFALYALVRFVHWAWY